MAVKRIRNHGKLVWMARVAYRGRRRATFCESKEAARQAEADLLKQLKTEAGQEELEGQRPATLRKLFEYYAEDLEARGKGADTIGRAAETAKAVERLMPELLEHPVGKIGDREIFAFRNLRAREGSLVRELVAGVKVERRVPSKPSTVNRDLRTLRAMLKKARPEYRFPAGAFFREDETRVRWLRPEEELLVLETMPSPFREVAKLAALTLMRLSEIRTLRREDLHLEQGVILLPRTKTEPRPVVLSSSAQKLLRGQLEAVDQAHTEAARQAEADGKVPRPRNEYVFPGPDGVPYSRVHVSRVFRKATRAAGLRDFHFHDLRHHGATMALNKGFTAPIVMQLGGWKTEKMMRRYAAVTDQTLRAAAEAVSGSEPVTRMAGR